MNKIFLLKCNNKLFNYPVIGMFASTIDYYRYIINAVTADDNVIKYFYEKYNQLQKCAAEC